MSRPRCCRRIGFMPDFSYFKPAGVRVKDLDEVILTLEEFEAIRLKDFENLDQDNAAKRMNISQPTFHRMIDSARKKIADAIINGKAVKICGGNYNVDSNIFLENKNSNRFNVRNKMKIAIASDDEENISQHFGRAEGFKIFSIESGKVISEEYRKNIGKSNGECHSCNHSAMIENIKDCKFVISNGMGQRIFNDLVANNISPVVTDETIVKDALSKFIGNSLENKTERLH